MKLLSERGVRGNPGWSVQTGLTRKIQTGRVDVFGCVLLLLVAVLIIPVQSVRAGDGDLDPTFGSGGKVSTDFSGAGDLGHAVATQPDGNIIVVGQSGINGVYHSALVRYNPNGSLDSSFGFNGQTVVTLDGAGDLLVSVIVLPNGKI